MVTRDGKSYTNGMKLYRVVHSNGRALLVTYSETVLVGGKICFSKENVSVNNWGAEVKVPESAYMDLTPDFYYAEVNSACDSVLRTLTEQIQEVKKTMKKKPSVRQLLSAWRAKPEFRVAFTKRTTGGYRELRCTFTKLERVEVTKQRLKDLQKKKLRHVYDLDADQIKTIPLDSILWLECEGVRHEFEREKSTASKD